VLADGNDPAPLVSSSRNNDDPIRSSLHQFQQHLRRVLSSQNYLFLTDIAEKLAVLNDHSPEANLLRERDAAFSSDAVVLLLVASVSVGPCGQGCVELQQRHRDE
jgi:hypothetical protein